MGIVFTTTVGKLHDEILFERERAKMIITNEFLEGERDQMPMIFSRALNIADLISYKLSLLRGGVNFKEILDSESFYISPVYDNGGQIYKIGLSFRNTDSPSSFEWFCMLGTISKISGKCK